MMAPGGHNALADIAPTKPELAEDSSETEGSKSQSGINALLDFNPCASMSSAVFKERKCHHCGKAVNKVCSFLSATIALMGWPAFVVSHFEHFP
jgi:hypothetical protein